jgi:hypothetical protein
MRNVGVISCGDAVIRVTSQEVMPGVLVVTLDQTEGEPLSDELLAELREEAIAELTVSVLARAG